MPAFIPTVSTTTVRQCSGGKGYQQEIYLGFDAMHYIKVKFALSFIWQVLLRIQQSVQSSQKPVVVLHEAFTRGLPKVQVSETLY